MMYERNGGGCTGGRDLRLERTVILRSKCLSSLRRSGGSWWLPMRQSWRWFTCAAIEVLLGRPEVGYLAIGAVFELLVNVGLPQ